MLPELTKDLFDAGCFHLPLLLQHDKAIRRLEEREHPLQELETREEGEVISAPERADPLHGIGDPGVVLFPVGIFCRDLGDDQELPVLTGEGTLEFSGPDRFGIEPGKFCVILKGFERS